jgi:hypothetical protein
MGGFGMKMIDEDEIAGSRTRKRKYVPEDHDLHLLNRS